MNDNENYTNPDTTPNPDNTVNNVSEPNPAQPVTDVASGTGAENAGDVFAPENTQPVILPGQTGETAPAGIQQAQENIPDVVGAQIDAVSENVNAQSFSAVEDGAHPEDTASTQNPAPESEPSPYFYNYPVAGSTSSQQSPVVQPASSGQNTSPQNPTGYPYTPQYGAGGNTFPNVKKSSNGLKIFAIVLAMVIVAVGCFSVGFFARNDLKENNAVSSVQSNKTSSDSTGSASSFDIAVNEGKSDGKYTYEQVADVVLPSVVSITIYASDGSAGGYASGVIMTDDGYVLTNDHIYTDVTAPKLLVTLYDNTEYKAEFVAGDARSDLSIIKLQNARGLKAATFGSSAALELGEEVMAIGSSDGLSGTVTTGVISSKERRVSYTSENYSIKLIQMSAIINPGSSGGALVNMNGEVVGITSSKIVTSNVEGICFAIPSDYAVEMVKNMQQNGTVTGRAKLGITYTSIGTVSAEVNNLPKGVYIQSVVETGCLAGKDVLAGDIITKANGKDISSGDDLLDIMESAHAGDTIQLTLYRPDTDSTFSVSAVLDEYAGTTNYSTAANNDLPNNDDSSSEDFLLPNPNADSSSSERPTNPFSSR